MGSVTRVGRETSMGRAKTKALLLYDSQAAERGLPSQDLHPTPLHYTEQGIILQGSLVDTDNAPPVLGRIERCRPITLNLSFCQTFEEHEDADNHIRRRGNIQWRRLLICRLRQEAYSNVPVPEERREPVPINGSRISSVKMGRKRIKHT